MEQHIFRSHQGRQMFYAWFSAMHTRVDIVFTGRRLDEQQCVAVVHTMAQRIAEVESCANCFDPSSELSQVNAGGRDELSPLLGDILGRCLYYNKVSEGLFDVMMPEGRGYEIQGNKIVLNSRINLSGFLKGYALDLLKPIAEANGLSNALISLGNSSVLAMGCGLDDRPWRVTIPMSGQEVELQDECLTTSGNDSAGRRHIVDPQTLNYVEGQRQVSVVTPNATLGEVLSTCFFIGDKKKRLHLASLFHVDRYYLSPATE